MWVPHQIFIFQKNSLCCLLMQHEEVFLICLNKNPLIENINLLDALNQKEIQEKWKYLILRIIFRRYLIRIRPSNYYCPQRGSNDVMRLPRRDLKLRSKEKTSRYTLKKCSLLKTENNSSWVNFTHFLEKTDLLALELIFISSSWQVYMHIKFDI